LLISPMRCLPPVARMRLIKIAAASLNRKPSPCRYHGQLGVVVPVGNPPPTSGVRKCYDDENFACHLVSAMLIWCAWVADRTSLVSRYRLLSWTISTRPSGCRQHLCCCRDRSLFGLPLSVRAPIATI
jgi:hypothetical protein